MRSEIINLFSPYLKLGIDRSVGLSENPRNFTATLQWFNHLDTYLLREKAMLEQDYVEMPPCCCKHVDRLTMS